MTITMYDLAGAEANRRFSPFCWRARMALAHKGLAVETVPWGFTEKDKLPQPNAGRVPVIVDSGTVVHDSTAIADYLEEHYADQPSLFGGETGRALVRFVLTVDLGPIGLDVAAMSPLGADRSEERHFRRAVGHVSRQWPAQPGAGQPLQH